MGNPFSSLCMTLGEKSKKDSEELRKEMDRLSLTRGHRNRKLQDCITQAQKAMERGDRKAALAQMPNVASYEKEIAALDNAIADLQAQISLVGRVETVEIVSKTRQKTGKTIRKYTRLHNAEDVERAQDDIDDAKEEIETAEASLLSTNTSGKLTEAEGLKMLERLCGPVQATASSTATASTTTTNDTDEAAERAPAETVGGALSRHTKPFVRPLKQHVSSAPEVTFVSI